MKKENRIPAPTPEESARQFARAMLPVIRQYFESEEGQQAFAAWKAEKERAQTEVSRTNAE